ncbi:MULTISPECIES: protease modulator HflK [unclassified Pseudomonas]|uniref:protease modulator HflK n=1 Tax=unclassified Pseudomonas TaxID=196821 RepID=UPI0011A45CCC|nr:MULTISPECIES: protease modulator HflK [unclassified Pseudomonas]TWC10678.1 regulator of protease activity HflC (stomatin/prohibitin superfamily) [Pseudomonas sp. SJZ075]TWC26882.1 regulator of protease activity HflC (stomatin/prohibitin superfamily) [Pseudomonas sp. SJZ078]TWC46291.1 regulator of protease activity HflC (stomatin/prohibitin superfamily) [Pseudomonas sp. SJZ124]TWC81753.1 regulator of protease activity HflC (stomatin/prohibitin superfamily) [Pseudomonas sp. SJZ101]
MQVDLDIEGAQVAERPRFQQARSQGRRLRRVAFALAVLAGLGLVSGFFVGLFSPQSMWPALLASQSAALLVLVAGLQSAWWVTQWRSRALLPAAVIPTSEQEPVELSGWYERLLERISARWIGLLNQIGAPTLWLAGWAGLALLSLEQAWSLALPAATLGISAGVGAVLSLLLAFALLVFERQLAQQPTLEWPEAASLAQLTRLTIIVLVLGALCLLFASESAIWPVRLAVLMGLLPGLAAVELLLRALLSLFSPRRDSLEPTVLGRSVIADLLRWPPQPLLALQHELHNRFGIDLRQIWAFSYMRRALFPVLVLVALVGWLLTGVHEVPLQGRGIYERFGKPVEVFGPGLQFGLPWPLGRVLNVENGIVHELATSVGESRVSTEADTAEGPAPAIANRLWDASHVNDKSQVIASRRADQQSFQIVNMDVRFVYRIGLTDAAALAATYNSADIPTLIRSTASRVLVHEFASRTLDGLLGADRVSLADEIGRAVQTDLQALDSGVEILATVVEAIHPPAGAANAYHGVQAAQIGAQALIARERGAAAEQTNQAQLQASIAHDQAQATAREINATAQASDLRFSAERKAYATAGHAFVLEQYLSQLSRGLANAKLLILDHRLGGSGNAPTIDLRTFTLPADPASPRNLVQPGAAH